MKSIWINLFFQGKILDTSPSAIKYGILHEIKKEACPLRHAPKLFLIPDELSTEVIEVDHIILDAEAMKQIDHRLRHHRRTAQVVLDVLWRIVLLEVSITHHRSDESGRVLHAKAISLRIRTVKRQVEVEVRELLLHLQEVLHEEDLVDGTGAVEVMHLTIRSVERLQHMHDLRTERSHTGTTTDPNHLFL